MRVVVVGAGVLGVSTAYFLGKAGHEVVVLEQNEGSALDTSFANGGMLTPSQAAPWNTPGIALKVLKWLGHKNIPFRIQPLALLSRPAWALRFLRSASEQAFIENLGKNSRLAHYTLDLLRQLRDQLDIKYDSGRQGTIKVFRDHNAFVDAIDLHKKIAGNLLNYRILERGSLESLEPALVPVLDRIAGAIHYPDDESGDAHKFCQELERHARQNSVSFRFNTKVNGFHRDKDRILGVSTSAGEVEGDNFIIAAGSYSPQLAAPLGVSLPINPVKGYSLTLPGPKNALLPSIPIIDESRHLAVTPLGSRIRISGSAEIAGFDRSIKQQRLTMMLDFFRELFPLIADSADRSEMTAWTGLRPYSADGVPILGRCEISNLFLNTGHGHLGWSMSLGSACLLSDMIDGRKTELDSGPYSIQRFSR
jgi:D-amino-acid dehydrogenase